MSEMMDVAEDKVVRSEAKYEPRYNRFLLHAKNYVQQYNQIYLHRMEQMKGHLQDRAKTKWGDSCQVLSQIIDLESEHLQGKECVLIGMTFKDLKLRGSILDNFKDGNIGGALNAHAILTSDKDTLILEDHSGRVALAGEIAKQVSTLVTGIMLAAKGTMNEFGEFNVNEWLYFFDVDEKVPATNSPSSWSPSKDSKLVLFVSGLNVGSTGATDVHDLSIQLLVDFVGGRFGDDQATDLASKIVRVIVAGDSVVQPDNSVVKERFSSQKTKASLSNPSKQLDVFIAQLLNSCHVNILPGASDPANVSLPQQPFHPCLFPHSARFNSFERVTNPCEMKLDEVIITGHSGQAVTDIARQTFKSQKNTNTAGHVANGGDLAHTCATSSSISGGEGNMDSVDESNNVVSSIDNDIEETVVFDPKPQKLKPNLNDANRRLEVLADTLAWGHLCPTIPDTLPCYPFSDVDPFIVDPKNIPAVLFAGNQPNYASKLVDVSTNAKEHKAVRLICIPDFRKTGTIVLCDISNPELPCITMSFK